MQSQLADLDVTFLDFQNVVRHQISGFEEQAYSFDFKGEYYLLPANSIPSVINYYENEVKIVRDEIEHWSNAPLGDPVNVSDLQYQSSAGELAIASLGVFEGMSFLIYHKESLFQPLSADDFLAAKRFYFGTDEVKDNLSDIFELSGLTDLQGKYAYLTYNENLADVTRDSMCVRVESDDAVYSEKIKQPLTMKKLMIGQKTIMTQIRECAFTPYATVVYDYSSSIALLIYTRAVLKYVIGLSRTVFAPDDYNELFILINGNMIHFKVSEFKQESKLATVRVGDYELLCDLDCATGHSFLVKGYQLLSDNGEPVRWDGERLSRKEVHEAGLESEFRRDDNSVETSSQSDSTEVSNEFEHDDADYKEDSALRQDNSELTESALPTMQLESDDRLKLFNEASIDMEETRILRKALIDKTLVF